MIAANKISSKGTDGRHSPSFLSPFSGFLFHCWPRIPKARCFSSLQRNIAAMECGDGFPEQDQQLSRIERDPLMSKELVQLSPGVYGRPWAYKWPRNSLDSNDELGGKKQAFFHALTNTMFAGLQIPKKCNWKLCKVLTKNNNFNY